MSATGNAEHSLNLSPLRFPVEYNHYLLFLTGTENVMSMKVIAGGPLFLVPDMRQL